MAAIVVISSEHGLRIEAHCKNQPDKSKLALYKPLLSLQQSFKQQYIRNKTECFRYIYKGGCGVQGIVYLSFV